MESEIGKIHRELLEGKSTCAGLVQRKLDELEQGPYNTANFLLSEYALERAEQVDRKLKAGEEIGWLEGIPFGVKDVYLLQGLPAAASSDFLRNYISPYTATAIQKLLDQGAIPVVKENCDSFGHGSSTENTAFGPARNALDTERVAGGSSGGSAVNVARGYTVFSIGGDTGGSIRQPAGYNRVFGLKPTYGRISRYGLMAYASSTDSVGPISRSLEDIRHLLNVMSGRDVHDQTSFDAPPVPDDIFRTSATVRGMKVGYYNNFVDHPDLDPGIRSDFMALLKRLEDQGAEVLPLDFFDTELLVSSYYVIAMAETASNLARLDGMAYGERITADTLKEGYALTRSKNFTEETRRRIIGGNQVLSHGHAEEIYQKARALRDQITRSFEKDFARVDLMVSPVSPAPPPVLGSSLEHPLKMYLSDAYTVGFSLGGLPTLTAPVGTVTGIQITAPKAEEQRILQFAGMITEIG